MHQYKTRNIKINKFLLLIQILIVVIQSTQFQITHQQNENQNIYITGQLEAKNSEQEEFHPYCTYNLSDIEADLICKELGYYQGSYGYQKQQFCKNKVEYYQTSFKCTENDKQIEQCEEIQIQEQNCNSVNDCVQIYCKNEFDEEYHGYPKISETQDCVQQRCKNHEGYGSKILEDYSLQAQIKDDVMCQNILDLEISDQITQYIQEEYYKLKVYCLEKYKLGKLNQVNQQNYDLNLMYINFINCELSCLNQQENYYLLNNLNSLQQTNSIKQNEINEDNNKNEENSSFHNSLNIIIIALILVLGTILIIIVINVIYKYSPCLKNFREKRKERKLQKEKEYMEKIQQLQLQKQTKKIEKVHRHLSMIPMHNSIMDSPDKVKQNQINLQTQASKRFSH